MSPFGEKTKENNYIALKDSILYKNTTLYCVTEVQSTPQVIWTFLHPSGVNTILPAPTNTTTGVSTLYVTNDKPGIYTCVVSQNGGRLLIAVRRGTRRLRTWGSRASPGPQGVRGALVEGQPAVGDHTGSQGQEGQEGLRRQGSPGSRGC